MKKRDESKRDYDDCEERLDAETADSWMAHFSCPSPMKTESKLRLALSPYSLFIKRLEMPLDLRQHERTRLSLTI